MDEKKTAFAWAMSEGVLTPAKCATKAGYAENTAHATAARLIQERDVQCHIKALRDAQAKLNILTPAQCLAMMSEVAQSEDAIPGDRLRALAAITKHHDAQQASSSSPTSPSIPTEGIPEATDEELRLIAGELPADAPA